MHIFKQKITKVNTNILFNMLSIALIVGFFLSFIYLASVCHIGPYGESDDYIATTIAIQRHQSLLVTPEDVETVKNDFPEQYEYVKNSYDSGAFAVEADGGWYAWYMGTYSISVIPMKHILLFLDLPRSRAYVYSNVVYYTLSLLVVFFLLKTSRKNVFLTLLMLTCSPTILMYFWTSAEMFIASLLIISIVFFVNRNSYLAALFCSIASTLNIVINAFGLIILADYFWTNYISKWKEQKYDTIKKNWKKTLVLGICYLPALITPVFNLYISGSIALQLGASNHTNFREMITGIFGRFFAYLFDLNLGFFAYTPILLLLSFAFFVIAIKKKNQTVIMLGLGLFFLVISYSMMMHINSGMTGMARYNTWSISILFFIVGTQYDSLLIRKVSKHIIVFLILISSILSFVILKSVMENHSGSYTEFTPMAKLVLNNAPYLYNPNPATFISRNENVDGGYYLVGEPSIYANGFNQVTKIYLPYGKVSETLEFLNGSEENLLKLESMLNEVKIKEGGYRYINLEKEDGLSLKIPRNFTVPYKKGQSNIYHFALRYVYKNQNVIVDEESKYIESFQPETVVWGPYYPAKSGLYEVTISYQYRDTVDSEATLSIVSDHGVNNWKTINLVKNKTEVNFEFELGCDVTDIEFIVNNGINDGIRLYNLIIKKIE